MADQQTGFIWPPRPLPPIPLWEGAVPYAAHSPDQAPPSVAPFPKDGARGAVVVIPGGGYYMKADHEGAPIARMLNSAGIAAYVLDYRVHPCHPMAPLSDAQRAIRLVRSLGYEKVGVLGFSAGGNICCSAAVHYDPGKPNDPDPVERLSCRPDAFIPCYPVVTFREPYTHLSSRQGLLREDWEKEEWVRYFSAEENVTQDTPPAFIWHTAADETVPVQNSLLLAKALSDHQVPFEMHIYPFGGHGMGLAGECPSAGQWGGALCRWLLEMGWGA